MRQEMPENTRISGTSQVYLLVREKELPTFTDIDRFLESRSFGPREEAVEIGREADYILTSASIRNMPIWSDEEDTRLLCSILPM